MPFCAGVRGIVLKLTMPSRSGPSLVSAAIMGAPLSSSRARGNPRFWSDLLDGAPCQPVEQRAGHSRLVHGRGEQPAQGREQARDHELRLLPPRPSPQRPRRDLRRRDLRRRDLRRRDLRRRTRRCALQVRDHAGDDGKRAWLWVRSRATWRCSSTGRCVRCTGRCVRCTGRCVRCSSRCVRCTGRCVRCSSRCVRCSSRCVRCSSRCVRCSSRCVRQCIRRGRSELSTPGGRRWH